MAMKNTTRWSYVFGALLFGLMNSIIVLGQSSPTQDGGPVSKEGNVQSTLDRLSAAGLDTTKVAAVSVVVRGLQESETAFRRDMINALAAAGSDPVARADAQAAFLAANFDRRAEINRKRAEVRAKRRELTAAMHQGDTAAIADLVDKWRVETDESKRREIRGEIRALQELFAADDAVISQLIKQAAQNPQP